MQQQAIQADDLHVRATIWQYSVSTEAGREKRNPRQKADAMQRSLHKDGPDSSQSSHTHHAKQQIK
jgi:hypothetical protein